jgi:hypothetical protein
MTEQKKNSRASTANKQKKLVPRTAPKPEAPTPVVDTALPAVDAPAAVPATTAAAAKVQTPRQPLTVDETVAKHQKVLAEALEKAQAIRYEQPALMTPAASKAEKPPKPARLKKPKLIRDSYAMPETEYAQLADLKKRLQASGCEVKKSELLRAGIAALSALGDSELQAVMARVERIKTGRPAK